jgi:hypothetical protein
MIGPAGDTARSTPLMHVDGHTASASSVLRAIRRHGLLQPIDYQGQRRELAKARKAAFATLATGQVQRIKLVTDNGAATSTTGRTASTNASRAVS